MDRIDHLQIEDIYGSRLKSFQRLMQFKIRDILLVASLYDNYLFEEDGRLYELIRQEFQVLNLSQPPEITHVTSAAEAIDLLQTEEHFDLIIADFRETKADVLGAVESLRKRQPEAQIILICKKLELEEIIRAIRL